MGFGLRYRGLVKIRFKGKIWENLESRNKLKVILRVVGIRIILKIV